jgi:hypothetical protein
MRVLGRWLCMDPTSINTVEGDEGNGNELLEKVRHAILAGKLPKQEPAATFGGRGEGASCAICGEPVAPDQIEFEIEFAPGAGTDAGPGPYHLHARCFRVWETECRSILMANPTATKTGGAPRSAPDGPAILEGAQ